MKKEKKKKVIIAVVVILLVIIAGALVAYFTMNQKNNETEQIANVEENIPEEVVEEEPPAPQINIYKGNDRPIAFMIDNNKNAFPHSSINSTYIAYEIIVEGGESRVMAVFKGVSVDQVGPIRSARHYFLDYALENDAIYAHLGSSPQALRDIESYRVNNVNGINYDSGKARTPTALYWRATNKKAPHNAYTNTNSILQIAKESGYRTTSNKESVLNYVPEEINLEAEDARVANKVRIPYSSSNVTEYQYNPETRRYTRYSKKQKMTDEVTGEDVTTKNIILTFAQNTDLNDGENKGRQNVVTVGELNGYYITNGKAIPIICKKSSRSEQTTYVDANGEEIKVNDGNTWVNICPIDANVTFSE